VRAFAERRLTEPLPYLILDARYEKVRDAGVIVSRAVLIAVAVDGDGRGLKAHEVRRDIAAWLEKWQAKRPKLCDWVKENIEEMLTYYRLPLPYHKHMKSTNRLELASA
jgi:transposase-like protein